MLPQDWGRHARYFVRMSKLIYITSTSLDGYVEDENGAIDWGDAQEVHEFITELVRPIATFLCGRRLHQTMSYWDAPAIEDFSRKHRAFARVWQKAQKIVFSRTLTSVPSGNTRLERNFDPEAIRKLKRESTHDISIGVPSSPGLRSKPPSSTSVICSSIR